MKVYKTDTWSTDVIEKEITRMTDSRIYFNKSWGDKKETWENVKSRYHKYHSSKDDAINYLIWQRESDVVRAETNLEDARKDLRDIKTKYGKN